MPNYKNHPAYSDNHTLKLRYDPHLDAEDPKKGTPEFEDALKAAGVSDTRVAVARMLEFAEENDPSLIDAVRKAHNPDSEDEAARMRDYFRKPPWER